jgi:hypothetical protein
MRVWVFRTLCIALLALGWARPALVRADQRQDWILAAGKEGNFVTLDLLFGGAQASVEHRHELYGSTNMLSLRAGALAALPFGSTQVDVELRMLNLTLGTSVGAQSVWRNQTFAPGASMTRKERREREAAGEFNTDNFFFWEGRAGLAFPFNDYVLLNQMTAWRLSGATDRSFNNVLGIVESGNTLKIDFQLFFKHEKFGGLAPMFQILGFDLDDDYRIQYNWGFMLVTRAGLVQRDDLIVWQMLFNTGPVFGGGYDNRDVYGSALFRAPLTFLLVYRSIIEL